MIEFDEDVNGVDNFTKKLVKTAPMPEVPFNFTEIIMSRITPMQEAARFEKSLTMFFLMISVIAVLISLFSTTNIVLKVLSPLKGAPWLLIMTATSLLLVIKLFEMIGKRGDAELQGNF